MKTNLRKRLFQIIEVADENDKISGIYDALMLLTILISLIPLAFKYSSHLFSSIELVTVSIFIIDYALRWVTADYKLDESSFLSFVKYPLTPIAIIDLISILPALHLVNKGFKLLRLVRITRMFRVLRIFKAFRYSKSMILVGEVIKNSSEALIAVASLAIGYIFVIALIMFNIEPETFDSFHEAIYWATISLTTVGYGDIYAVTAIGKTVTMISSIAGIAVVALPSGIITAGYMQALEDSKESSEN